MALGKTNGNDSNWISFSDIMTGLMVIFMFIAISYMAEHKKKEQERERIFKEFKETKKELVTELKDEFEGDFAAWEVELDTNDLSIKFTNPDVLFETGKHDIRPRFRSILNQFLPRYFDILLQPKYSSKISEIRIEGHADTLPALNYDLNPYIGNIKLSQARSAEVLKHFMAMPYYGSLPDSSEQRLQFLLTANGLSFGRTLDDNKQLTAISGLPMNEKLSKRVEFRIVTTSEALVESVLKDIER